MTGTPPPNSADLTHHTGQAHTWTHTHTGQKEAGFINYSSYYSIWVLVWKSILLIGTYMMCLIFYLSETNPDQLLSQRRTYSTPTNQRLTQMSGALTQEWNGVNGYETLSFLFHLSAARQRQHGKFKVELKRILPYSAVLTSPFIHPNSSVYSLTSSQILHEEVYGCIQSKKCT